MNKELRDLLREKGAALSTGDSELVKEIQRKIKQQTEKCKHSYKEKIEQNFRENNPRKAWKTMQDITGYNKDKSKSTVIDQDSEFVDELNDFYCRFDVDNYSHENEEVRSKVKDEIPDRGEPIQISEHEVRRIFASLQTHKSPGPDGISNKVLKVCKDQLAPVFTKLFEKSLSLGTIPQLWKQSIIIPIPKGKQTKEMNDFRPISLTCSVMKCLEKIVLKLLMSQVGGQIDVMQFAYRQSRGVDDAILTYLHNIYNHLDHVGNSVRCLFVDFSIPFNTIVPHILIKKLIEMQPHPTLILWIQDFFNERQQYVHMRNVNSKVRTINIGAPQGCVLSPVLFSIYTSNCVSTSSNCQIIKYADDTVISGNMSDTKSENDYVTTVNKFVEWCERHHLKLNVTKTKEMIIDFRRSPHARPPLIIQGSAVERVHNYKYLGTTVCNTLDWSCNITLLRKKCNQRMYFLRMMRKMHVDKTILILFYRALIESIATNNIICYFGNATQADRKKLDSARRIAQRIIGSSLHEIPTLYEERVVAKVKRIMNDPTHPLHPNYNYNRSGFRLCVPRSARARTRQSFTPNSIHLYNGMSRRPSVP